MNQFRKLLFTHEDVLPHKVGVGFLPFTHARNQRSESQQITVEETDLTLSAEASSTDAQEDNSQLVHDKLAQDNLELSNTKLSQLSITDGPLDDSKVMTTDGADDRSITFDIPVTNSTATVQQTGHFPIASAGIGNHGDCTSVFIDVVDWLSPLIVGQMDGKVK